MAEAGIRKVTEDDAFKADWSPAEKSDFAMFGRWPVRPSPQAAQMPASLQSLGRMSGQVGGGGGGGFAPGGGLNDEAERLRVAGRDEGRYDTEDDQSFQLQLAGMRGKDATDARTSDQAFARESQDRMLALIQPHLNKSVDKVAAPSDADATAAQDAAFARAKDRTAQLARSSLMALRASSAERGVNVAGGTNPALLATEGKILGGANQPLADLTREQAIQTTGRAQQVADRNYQGEITQAGQRAALAPSLLSLMRMSY